MRLWRISNHASLSGEGGLHASGRWHTRGRRVVYTGKHLQLVLMALKPGEEIGEEVHDDRDQFFRIEEGEGVAVIDGQRHAIKDDDAIVVPAGARHNVINTSGESRTGV